MKNKITLLLLFVLTYCSAGMAQITANLSVSPGTTVCDNEPVTFTVTVVGCTLTYKVNWIVDGFIHDSCTGCTTWNTALSTTSQQTTAHQVWCSVSCNPMGNDNSDAIAMTVNPCSGIEEYKNGSKLRLYPNPSPGNIIIDAENLQMFPVSLTISNGKGKIVNVPFQIKDNVVVFDASHFENGVYYYRLADKSGGISATGKFLISK